MPYSTAKLLTEQFYRWEQRGRGHFFSETSVQLEPVFVPFFGHFVDSPYVDDGRRHTLLSSLKSLFVREHAVADPEPLDDMPIAFGDVDEDPPLTIYTITLPKQYVCKSESVERCFGMLSACKQAMSFEIIATATEMQLQVACRDDTAPFIQTQLKAYFPKCTISETYDDEVLYHAKAAESAYVVDFGLEEEFTRPIASLNGSHDPYTSLLATADHLRDGEVILLQVLFCGTQNPWAESIIASVADDKGGSFFLDAPEMPNLAKEKVSHPLLGATVRLAAFAPRPEKAMTLLQHCAIALLKASASPHNALLPLSNPEYDIYMRLEDLVLRKTRRVGMLLNASELATLAHFPNANLSKKLFSNRATTKPAPAHLDNQSYVLGVNEHHGSRAEVGISVEQRTRHIHLLGASGTGKSTLLHSLICQDIHAGIGCCVLDPHGDLVETVLRSIPKERIGDVVLIDPSDTEHAIAFNILSAHSDLERELLASDLVALFKRFSTSWGDQLHSVLANAIMAFLFNKQAGHLGDLRKFLIEPQFRASIIATCTDEELVYYWQKEYPLLKTSSIGSILTRLDSFLRPKVIRAMVCQHRGLDFAALMDSGKIILVKLSQGLIGAENSYLLGACIISKLQQAAMSRQSQLAKDRTPFFCYIDEFHHFITPSMEEILSGARKYSFGLVLAHQEMQQVQRYGEDVTGAIMTSVGTRICFRLSDSDAKRMQTGFSGFDANDLQNLATGEAIARVNTADADFNLSVKRAETQQENVTELVKTASRDFYGIVRVAAAAALTEEPLHVKPKHQTIPEPVPYPANGEKQPATEPPPKQVQEHRYLQSFIKAMAEQHGYRAHTELPASDGSGRIDVVLEKGEERIAVEISITTDAEWEMHNIRKCLNSGYSRIVVCSPDRKKLQQVQRKIGELLPPPQQALIQTLTPEEIPRMFSNDKQVRDSAAMMKGYRVTTKRVQSGNNNAEIIHRILNLGKP